jgi:hypothetical protein
LRHFEQLYDIHRYTKVPSRWSMSRMEGYVDKR